MLMAQQVQREVFEFAALPTGWLRLLGLLLLLTLGYVAVWLYRREARVGASPALRTLLAAVRCVVLLVLALIALRPAIVTYLEQTTPARVAVLVDASASMAVADAAGGATEAERSRTAQVAHLLAADDAAWLRRLAKENEPALYDFGGQAVPRPLPAGLDGRVGPASLPAAAGTDARPPSASTQPTTAGTEARPTSSAPSTQPTAEPDISRTDVGQAVATVLEDAGRQPLAGVVLLTDGEVTRGMTLAEVATYAKRHKLPVYVVGVGAPAEPPNVRVTDFAVPSVVPRGDPFEIRADVAVTGAEPADLTVTLALAGLRNAATPARVVATRQVHWDGEHQPEPLRFTVDPNEAGDFVYRLAVTGLPGEALADDNVRAAPVRVLQDQLRVLILAGRPSYDYRYVTHLFERDQTINVSCWLQSADAAAVRDGDTIIKELPRKPEDIFAYDALVLLDPNPADLDASWAVTVRRFVDEFGGGVLYEAGTHFTTRFLRDERLTDLIGLLPIVPDPEADVRLSEGGAFHTRAAPLSVPETARGHPLVAFDPDPTTNDALWSALPPVWWTLPVRRTKPLAAPLLVRADAPDTPLLAVQPVGTGRCAFLGIESTWRWRSSAEPLFNRFWIQTVRYLAYARRQSTSNRGTLVLERETVDVGDYLRIEARILDESFSPLHVPSVTAQVSIDEAAAQDVVLLPIVGRDGWFAGRCAVTRAGAGLVRITLPGGGAPASAPARATTSAPTSAPQAAELVRYFAAQRPDVEMRRLALAEEELKALAVHTGGRYVTLADASRLPTEIKSAAQTRVDRGPVRDLWDRTWLLLLLAALLGVEWALRRRNQLL